MQVPSYALSAGIPGLVVAGSIGFTVPRLGLSTASTIIVAAQFIVALLLEHYGFWGEVRRLIDLNRMAGVGGFIVRVVSHSFRKPQKARLLDKPIQRVLQTARSQIALTGQTDFSGAYVQLQFRPG